MAQLAVAAEAAEAAQATEEHEWQGVFGDGVDFRQSAQLQDRVVDQWVECGTKVSGPTVMDQESGIAFVKCGPLRFLPTTNKSGQKLLVLTEELGQGVMNKQPR